MLNDRPAWRVGLLLLLLSLAACGSQPGSPHTSDSLQRLPTVTPFVATEQPSVEPTPSLVPAPSVVASPTPSAVAQELLLTAEGAITPAMAELNLGAERHAALGDPHAPITLVEFADYGCPSCRHFELFTFATLKERYIDSGKVFYVYKDFPIVSRQGHLAAQAAECAGEQGQFWEMHRTLFIEIKAWDTTEAQALATFQRLAAELGLDAAVLDTCVQEGRFAQEIEQDFQEGFALRLNGTPSFLINGKLLVGAQPAEVFAEVLDRELDAAR